MFCAAVEYREPNDGFDFDYFATRHAPRFAEMLGDNCERWEVQRPLPVPGAPPPGYVAAAYFWVGSAEGFADTVARHGAEIFADIANFSDVQPQQALCEVVTPVEATR